MIRSLLLFLLLLAPAGAAISFDSASTSAYFGGPTSLTWNHTVGGGSNGILVVGLSYYGPLPESMSVTFGGAAMTLGLQTSGTGAGNGAAQFYLTSPAAGTHAIVVSGTSPYYINGGGASFFGVDQSNPIDATATGTGFSGSTAVTITTVNANAWLVSTNTSTFTGATGTFNGNAADWNLGGASNPSGMGGHSGPVVSPGSTSATWVMTASGIYSELVLSLKPSAAGGHVFGFPIIIDDVLGLK